MKVYGHPDPWILERELERRVESAHPVDGRGSTLILVPTSRLAAHVERRFAASTRRRAWLGLHVRTFRGVAAAIVDRAGADVPLVAAERLRLAVARRVLESQPDNPWSAFVRRRPGAASRVRAALDELREAGITPDELSRAALGDPASAALAELYVAYAPVFDDGPIRGFSDEAGLVRAALPHAAVFGARYGAVFLHGAYELLGIHVELLHGIDAGREVLALVPVLAGAPATVYAERFARRFLRAEAGVVPIDAADAPGCGLALDALYDEARRPPAAAAPERVSFRTCQGAAAEIQAAVHHALRAVGAGAAPASIAIVARTLSPFAGAIDEALADAGLPFTSSVVAPLRRRPFVRDLLLLLRTVERDFPRAPTVELLRSPRVDWGRIVRGPRPSGERADAWSRRARIVGGIEEWAIGLPRWIEEDGARRARYGTVDDGWRMDEARRIARALSILRSRVGPDARPFREHAQRIGTLLDELFVVGEGREDVSAKDLVGDVLRDMERLESWLGDSRRVPFGDALDWLEQAIDATEHAPHDEDRGGIRVLDALRARGMTFDHVHLVGLNAGVFPRRIVEDPVLGDALRLRLRESTGRALPIRSEGRDEERLLLLLLVGGSGRSLDVSWQRAAEAGRVRSPSLALRELARIARGRPDLAALEPIDVPSHPEQWLRYAVEHGAGIAAVDRTLLLALSGHGPRARAELARAEPRLIDGLRTLAATETFDIVDPGFDARLGRPTIPHDPVSVTALEKLAQCPLRYFFERVLRVREPEDEVDALELQPRELGSEVHARLAELYRALDEEGVLVPGRLDAARERAAAMLDDLRHAVLGSLGQRMAARFPLLWQQIAGAWHAALAGFVDRDLRRIDAAGLALVGVEVEQTTELPVLEGQPLRIRGRFDRVLRSGATTVLSDYKTTRNPKRIEEYVSETAMLKGATLQVPLYQALAGLRTSVEVLGVGPVFDADPERERAVFDGFTSPEVSRGFLETVGALIDLLRRGSFPLHADRERCPNCPYRRSCRWTHSPTLVRESRDTDGASMAAIRRKTLSKPVLRGADGHHG